MFHMLTCFNLKPEITIGEFSQALSDLTKHLKEREFVHSTGPIGRVDGRSSLSGDPGASLCDAESVSGGEWPGGIAPPGSPRTVRERLRSHGSYHPTVHGMRERFCFGHGFLPPSRLILLVKRE